LQYTSPKPASNQKRLYSSKTTRRPSKKHTSTLPPAELVEEQEVSTSNNDEQEPDDSEENVTVPRNQHTVAPATSLNTFDRDQERLRQINQRAERLLAYRKST